MSRASATFYFDDGDITHGIYEGTCDIMQTFMSYDPAEPWDWYYGRGTWEGKRWCGKGEAFDRVEKCTHEGEHCLAYSDYGYGCVWEGKACRDCMVFRGPFEYGYDEAPLLFDFHSPEERDAWVNAHPQKALPK